MLCANSGSFPSSFLTWMSFISFTNLISLARTFRMLLNKISETSHFYFVPDTTLVLAGLILSCSTEVWRKHARHRAERQRAGLVSAE